jgi:hypothetical protein
MVATLQDCQGQMIKELLKSTKMEECNGMMIPIGEDYEEAQSEDSELLSKKLRGWRSQRASVPVDHREFVVAGTVHTS